MVVGDDDRHHPLGLLAVVVRSMDMLPRVADPVVPFALLIIGSTGVISILLPYTAENYPIKVRGRATGWVAGCSKVGGLIAQGLRVMALVPALELASLAIAVPAGLSLLLIAILGPETRNRDLRDLERAFSPTTSRLTKI
jgi:putative MFS transporter